MPAERKLVLVTGANGFVGSHCVLQLLQLGYSVRATVRNQANASKVKDLLAKHVDVGNGQLTFALADLTSDAGWASAARDCEWILHVASPVLNGPPKHPDDIIVPARDGTRRVLEAAASARVKRVVLTSSTAAVMWGHRRDGSETYTEDDWTVLSDELAPYERSKTLAEKGAWDFVNALPARDRFELVALQPGLVLGPVLGKNASVSGEVVRKLLTREFPGCPDLGFAAVDVRDVADAHVNAMTRPEAAGQRFILAIEHAPILRVAEILAKHFNPKGFKVPTGRLPSWLLRGVAMFDKTAALVIPELGKRHDVSSERARRVLDFRPRNLETMVVDMANSMIEHGIVPLPRRKGYARSSSAAQST